MKKGTLGLRLVFYLVFICVFAANVPAMVDNKGNEFWLGFMNNLGNEVTSLIITSDTAASGTVSVPGISWTTPFTTTPGSVTIIMLPGASVAASADAIENVGIHVTADNEVTVYGLSQASETTDAYLALPVDAIGTEYIVAAYANGGAEAGTEFIVVASQDNTSVTITPSVSAGSRIAGSPFTITLNAGQVFQLRNELIASNTYATDLTGSFISSDKPVSVFGGHSCANIPSDIPYSAACDHVIEQIPPVTAWGKKFLGMPLMTRTEPDTIVMIASVNNTHVVFNGTALPVVNRGRKIQVHTISGPICITSDKPILAIQYSNSALFDWVYLSDPFMMLLLPEGQYQKSYTIATPSNGIRYNYINLVVLAADIGSIILDGSSVPAGSFVPIPGSGYYGVQIPAAVGIHNVSGPSPFGVYVYGFDTADSYGYPGGCGVEDLLHTPTITPTNSPTFTITETNTISPTFTVSPTLTPTYTITMTSTFTDTPTVTPTSTPTYTITTTNTPTFTPTVTMTDTPTPTITQTCTPTFTPTVTMTGTPTFTITRTCTPTFTPTLTPTFTPTATMTSTPKPLILTSPGSFPNPFSDGTQIVYWLSTEATVGIKVFTISGEVVREYTDITGLAGYNSFYWDGRNKAQRHVASGVFIGKISAVSPRSERVQLFIKAACAK